MQLINGTDFAWKMAKSLGDKRKRIGDGSEGSPDHIAMLTRLYADFGHDVRKTVGEIGSNVDPSRDQTKSRLVSKVFDNRDFGYLKITVERPLRLNFTIDDERITRFKSTSAFESLAVSRKRKDKKTKQQEEMIGREAQAAILAVLENLRESFAGGRLVKDREEFIEILEAAFESAELSLDTSIKSALTAPGSLGEKDPTAEICFDGKGRPEPDADLRDTENVPSPADIELSSPLDYQGKKKNSKPDVEPLLELVRDHCETYLAKEVLPYRPDAWIDHSKIKLGYEIPFNRHFYEYEEPRPLKAIEREIKGLEKEIMTMLSEVV